MLRLNRSVCSTLVRCRSTISAASAASQHHHSPLCASAPVSSSTSLLLHHYPPSHRFFSTASTTSSATTPDEDINIEEAAFEENSKEEEDDLDEFDDEEDIDEEEVNNNEPLRDMSAYRADPVLDWVPKQRPPGTYQTVHRRPNRPEDTIAAFLKSLKLGDRASEFPKSPHDLAELRSVDLKKLGLTVKQRKSFLKLMDRWKASHRANSALKFIREEALDLTPQELQRHVLKIMYGHVYAKNEANQTNEKLLADVKKPHFEQELIRRKQHNNFRGLREPELQSMARTEATQIAFGRANLHRRQQYLQKISREIVMNSIDRKMQFEARFGEEFEAATRERVTEEDEDGIDDLFDDGDTIDKRAARSTEADDLDVDQDEGEGEGEKDDEDLIEAGEEDDAEADEDAGVDEEGATDDVFEEDDNPKSKSTKQPKREAEPDGISSLPQYRLREPKKKD